jgi:hypothetical protein
MMSRKLFRLSIRNIAPALALTHAATSSAETCHAGLDCCASVT